MALRGFFKGSLSFFHYFKIGSQNLANKRRIGINEGEFVVLDRTHKGISRNKDIFHGHVERWEDLRQPMRDALEKAGLTDKKGKILKK